MRYLLIVLLSIKLSFAGEVTYTQDAGKNWHAYNENGVELSQVGSICQGLDTAINYAVANSKQLRVMGGGASTFEPTVNCSNTLKIPPIEKAHLDLGAITLNFSAAIGANEGVVFDSCLNSYVRMDGQITYFGTSRALVFRPTSLLPMDTVAGATFANCELRINTAFGSGKQTSVVDFDTSQGSIIGNKFDFDEVHASATYNGSNCIGGWHGFRVIEGPTKRGFIGNHVDIRDLHGTCNVSAFIGANGPSTAIYDNYFDLNIYPYNGGYGVLTVGQSNEYHLTVLNNEGTVNGGIILNSSASNEKFYQRSIFGGVNDTSTAHSSKFY